MIQTDNYTLKKMRLEYVNNYYMSWFKNSEVKNTLVLIKNLSELKQDVKAKIKDKNSLFLGVFTNSKRHIGNILIHNINKKNHTAHLGILIGNKTIEIKKLEVKLKNI